DAAFGGVRSVTVKHLSELHQFPGSGQLSQLLGPALGEGPARGQQDLGLSLQQRHLDGESVESGAAFEGKAGRPQVALEEERREVSRRKHPDCSKSIGLLCQNAIYSPLSSVA
ncbi:hypothetical protein AVEN_28137-2-1, partial [Araneus ventricosus]